MANGGLLGSIINPAQADVIGAVDAGRERQATGMAGQILGETFTGKIGALARLNPDKAIALSKAVGIPLDDQGRLNNFMGTAVAANKLVQAGLIQEATQFVTEAADKIESVAGPGQAQRMRDMANRMQSGDPQAFEQLGQLAQAFDPQQRETAAQREFSGLTEGLSAEDELKARRVKLRIDAPATGSAAQTIAALGTAEDVGASQAIIKQREKFGELTGSSRAKSIDKGFENIVKLDKNIRNMGRAITAIDEGASTGAIESRFFPSFRKATLQLEALQKELALDVIGSVTFGALSQGELDLAQLVALPTNLEPEALKQHLTDRIAAQEKLRGYYQDQIDHLDQGGTIASFLRQQGRGATTDTTQAPAGGDAQIIQFDAQGNQL